MLQAPVPSKTGNGVGLQPQRQLIDPFPFPSHTTTPSSISRLPSRTATLDTTDHRSHARCETGHSLTTLDFESPGVSPLQRADGSNLDSRGWMGDGGGLRDGNPVSTIVFRCCRTIADRCNTDIVPRSLSTAVTYRSTPSAFHDHPNRLPIAFDALRSCPDALQSCSNALRSRSTAPRLHPPPYDRARTFCSRLRSCLQSPTTHLAIVLQC